MTRTPIEERWLSFRRMVIPKSAEEAQVEEYRKAFFAGAAAVWAYMMKSTSIDNDNEVMDLYTNIDDELQTFTKEAFEKAIQAMRDQRGQENPGRAEGNNGEPSEGGSQDH